MHESGPDFVRQGSNSTQTFIKRNFTMSQCETKKCSSGTPKITEMQVIPVAGNDSMLLNLSGAHSPFFTRNIVILKDNTGNSGVGEVPCDRSHCVL